jgi:hypothetical protein
MLVSSHNLTLEQGVYCKDNGKSQKEETVKSFKAPFSCECRNTNTEACKHYRCLHPCQEGPLRREKDFSIHLLGTLLIKFGLASPSKDGKQGPRKGISCDICWLHCTWNAPHTLCTALAFTSGAGFSIERRLLLLINSDGSSNFRVQIQNFEASPNS